MKQFLGFSAYSNQSTISKNTNAKQQFGRTCFSSNPSMNNSKSKDHHKSKEEQSSSTRLLKGNIKFPSNSKDKNTTLPKNSSTIKIYENTLQKFFYYIKENYAFDVYEHLKNKFIEELNRETSTHSNGYTNSMRNLNLSKNLKLSYETNLEDDSTIVNKKYNDNSLNSYTMNAKLNSYCHQTKNIQNTKTNKNSFKQDYSLKAKGNTVKSSISNLNKHSLYSLTKKGKIGCATTNNSKSNSLEHFPLSTKQSRQNSKKSNGNRNKKGSKVTSNNNISINGLNGHLSLNQKLFNKISNEINNNIRNNLNVNINKAILQRKNKNTRNYNFSRTATNSVKKNKSNTKMISTKSKGTKEQTENTKIQNDNQDTITNLVKDTGEFKGNEQKNSDQLREIKSSLDDNLKVMFNFSYECFLNKESESESRRSIEDNYNANGNYPYYNKCIQKNASMQISKQHN